MKYFRSNSMLWGAVLFLMASAPLALRAEIRLPALFSEHMVLQAGDRVPVWGWAKPGEKISIEAGDQKIEGAADSSGKWKVFLEPMKSGAHLVVTVKGENTIVIKDVLVGEVWLGSGQSNMQLTVRNANNFDTEKASADFPDIRMFTVALKASLKPLDDCRGSWQVCNSNTVGDFSAALYFFGRELHQKMHVPTGLIHSSWGGTPIQSWTSLEEQRNVPELKPLVEGFEKSLKTPFDNVAAEAELKNAMTNWESQASVAKSQGKPEPKKPRKRADPRFSEYSPGNLFNAMIAPLIPYRLRGAIWYQGEANGALDKSPLYRVQLPALIHDWRSRWNEGDFAFGWAQLPGYTPRTSDPGAPSGWALVREGMLKTLSLPNTGMGVNIDIGETDNIHPKNKQDVGHRLALWALSEIYHQPVVFSGPMFTSAETVGNQIVLKFIHTEAGLVSHGEGLKGFAIAGADRKWLWAESRIEGDTIVVENSSVPHPVAVRYGWANNPECNLFNGAGLPASPFRTDDWP